MTEIDTLGEGLDGAAGELRRYGGLELPWEHVVLTLAGMPEADAALADHDLQIAPGSESYAILAEAELTIIGGRPRAVLYGVYDVLEHHLGWCFAMPGEEVRLGDTQPHRECRIETPAFAIRGYGFHGGHEPPTDLPACIDWLAKHRFNRIQLPLVLWPDRRDEWAPVIAERDLDLDLGVHSLALFLPEARYAADHPDWYASVDNRHGRQLRFANLDSVPTVVANILEFLADEPLIHWLGLWPQDGTGFEPEETADGRFGEILLHYINAVAEGIAAHYPKLRFDHLAYVGYASAPATPSPHPAITTSVCHYWDRKRMAPIYDAWYGRARYGTEADIQESYERFHPWRTHAECCRDLAGWVELGPTIVFSYYTDPNLCGTHLLEMAPIIQADLQYYRELGVEGCLDCSCAPQHWLWMTHEHLALAAFLWDPDCAWKPLERRLLRAVYGEDAHAVEAMYGLLGRIHETPIYSGYRLSDLLTMGLRLATFVIMQPRVHQASLDQIDRLFSEVLQTLEAADGERIEALRYNLRRQRLVARCYQWLLGWRQGQGAAMLTGAERELADWSTLVAPSWRLPDRPLRELLEYVAEQREAGP